MGVITSFLNKYALNIILFVLIAMLLVLLKSQYEEALFLREQVDNLSRQNALLLQYSNQKVETQKSLDSAYNILNQDKRSIIEKFNQINSNLFNPSK